ncbi:hypothetical protein BgiMline_036843, partial [Biomphalaria glabrata]
MLLPKESYGKDFILFSLPSRIVPGVYVAIASRDETRMTIYASDEQGEETEIVNLAKASESIE